METRKQFNKNHQKTIKRLNNIFISADMIIPILQTEYDKIFRQPDKVFNFYVPSTNRKSKRREIPRKKQDFLQFLGETISFDLYKYMIISIVSLVEDFLSNNSKVILRKYPNKLTARSQANQTININRVLEAGNLDEVIESLINDKIISLFYGSPSKQFEYFNQVFQLSLEESVVSDYIEIKATRDLLVHAEGIVNDVYKSKVGSLARANIGERISLEEKYFEHVVKTCKKLIGIFRRECIKVYC